MPATPRGNTFNEVWSQVMAYLLRRVRENSDIMGGCAKEAAMIRAELKRRLLSWSSTSQAASSASAA